MKRLYGAVAALTLLGSATPLLAAPGVGEKVYGARLEDDTTEVELRYGRLSGGQADGEDGSVLELSHAFGHRFSLGALVETEREAHDSRKLDSVAIEGIVPLGTVRSLGLDVALYGEYEFGHDHADKLEGKLLLQHSRGPFDSRLNLIFEHELATGEPLELGYAASADWRTFGDIRLGAEAFGSLGSTRDFLPRDEHFAGPMIRAELEHLPGRGELEIETGYAFALGKARDETDGQFRLVLEYEFHF